MCKWLMVLLMASLLFNCNVGREFEQEFDKYISSSDSTLFDGYILHPTYAYMRNGKVIGIKSISNPECGQVHKSYFIGQNEIIEKIIYEKDYFNEHCGKTFDSVYVIEPINWTVKIYTKTTNGDLIINEGLIISELINFEHYKKNVKYWKVEE